MSWDIPSPAVAEASAALFAEPAPRLRCACGWAARYPGCDSREVAAHARHRNNCQARWSR
jgi:hypothetical protein